MNEPVLLTIPETANALRLGRSTVYELLASGTLRSVTVGRSRRIPVAALAEFVASLDLDRADALGTDAGEAM